MPGANQIRQRNGARGGREIDVRGCDAAAGPRADSDSLRRPRGKRRVVARLPKTVPDGVAVDEHGAIYVTCYVPSRIYRVDPSGEVRILLDDWFSHTLSNPTNVAFGGPKFNELFAANLGAGT